MMLGVYTWTDVLTNYGVVFFFFFDEVYLLTALAAFLSFTPTIELSARYILL